VGALLLGMLGLFMSLCGGGFTLMSFTEAHSTGLLVLTVPSLLLGIGLIWLCARILRRVPQEPDRPSGGDGPV
jgi:hypothetical protein